MKPSFFKNEDLATLSPLNRLLFAALWCLADREGRLEDRPLRIKAEAFPYDGCDIDKMLDKLADFQNPFIIRYQVEETRYIQITSAGTHFHCHPDEKRSVIPPYSGEVVKSHKEPMKSHLLIHGIKPCSPIPYTETPISESSPPSGGFELVWKDYPRREGKKTAERHYNASVKTMKDFLDIQNALSNYVGQLRMNRTELQFTKMGSTWFNNWRDYVDYKVDHSKVVKAPPAPPKPKIVEVQQDITRDELKKMHDERIDALGPCSKKKCEFCTENIQAKKLINGALATAGEGKEIPK